jgi:hypothetical protein
MAVANTLAYYDRATVIFIVSFIVQCMGDLSDQFTIVTLFIVQATGSTACNRREPKAD